MTDLKSQAHRYHREGAVPQAIELYQKAAAEAPNDPEIPFLMSSALRLQKRDSEAEQALLAALSLKPDFVEAHTNIGILYQNWGFHQKAEAHFQEAYTYEPNIRNAVNLSGIMQVQGRPAEACELLYPQLKDNPIHSVGWGTLGAALLDMGHREDASGCFARAHQYAPNDANHIVHLYAATVPNALGTELVQHTQMLEEALKRDPKHPMARFLLAASIYSTNPIEAKQHLNALVGPHFLPWKASLKHIQSHADTDTLYFADTASVLRYAALLAPENGQCLEFGVRYGTSTQIIQKATDSVVTGFDSFQGLPTAWHEQPAGAYSTEGYIPEIPNVRLIPGWFEDTVEPYLKKNPSPIRLANIDCDLYSSTKTVLDAITPYLQDETVLIFDEYIMNPKWQEDEFKAFQEWLMENDWTYRYKGVSYFTNQVIVQLQRREGQSNKR